MDNAVRGNARLAVAFGLEGSLAADLQLGTTGRWAYEMWQNVVADGLVVEGSDESGVKVGQEKGYRYPVLGPGFYSRMTLRSATQKAMKTSGRDCGPLTFNDVRIEDAGPQAWTVAHGGGTNTNGVRFNNPESETDLVISRDAYDPEQYDAGVRHTFDDLVGEGPERAVVLIGAPGIVIRRAERIEFVVQIRDFDPATEPAPEFIGPFIDCVGVLNV